MTGNLVESASVAAENTFTTALAITAKQRASISISGTFVATVTLQRRLDGTNWRDVESWTGENEQTYVADESCDLRLGVKTGNYSSDTAVCRIGIGQ